MKISEGGITRGGGVSCLRESPVENLRRGNNKGGGSHGYRLIIAAISNLKMVPANLLTVLIVLTPRKSDIDPRGQFPCPANPLDRG